MRVGDSSGHDGNHLRGAARVGLCQCVLRLAAIGIRDDPNHLNRIVVGIVTSVGGLMVTTSGATIEARGCRRIARHFVVVDVFLLLVEKLWELHGGKMKMNSQSCFYPEASIVAFPCECSTLSFHGVQIFVLACFQSIAVETALSWPV